MEKPRKRNDINIAQQYEVIQALDKNVSQVKVAEQFNISQSQVSRIKSKRQDIINKFRNSDNVNRKRSRVSTRDDIDTALMRWYTQARSNKIPVTGPLLMSKAKALSEELGVDEAPSRAWLQRWCRRHQIQYKKAHGEKQSHDQEAADHWVKNVWPEVFQKYKTDDIYNCDETGVFFRALPDSGMVHKSEKPSGSKISKERITALVCCNYTGTDKRRLFIIGKSVLIKTLQYNNFE